MRPIGVVLFALALGAFGGPAAAQEAPPPIPRFVIDVHAVVPAFPSDPSLAASRGVNLAELPGVGLGVDLAAHLYPWKWRAMTVGLGGRLVTSRARRTPAQVAGQPTTLRSLTERFTYLGPQVSFNFGTGAGWSYLSGGISASTWSIVPDGADKLPPDEDRLKTIDYGGGARWFAKPHVAFSFDVRFYAINPGSPSGALPGSLRTTLVVVGAGVSLK